MLCLTQTVHYSCVLDLRNDKTTKLQLVDGCFGGGVYWKIFVLEWHNTLSLYPLYCLWMHSVLDWAIWQYNSNVVINYVTIYFSKISQISSVLCHFLESITYINRHCIKEDQMLYMCVCVCVNSGLFFLQIEMLSSMAPSSDNCFTECFTEIAFWWFWYIKIIKFNHSKLVFTLNMFATTKTINLIYM